MPDSDIEDLLGRPKRSPAEPKPTDDQPLEEQSQYLDIRDVYRGVSINWLKEAFRMDRSTVKRRIADLAPLKYARGNIAIYDFVQAASCLVKPKLDIGELVKTMKPEDLPNDLQKEYWEALLKRQKYKHQAGEFWHTEDVINVFGEAFKHIKESTQLWVNALDRQTGLTPEQVKLLTQLADNLLEDIHGRLSKMKKKRRTPSTAEDVEMEDV